MSIEKEPNINFSHREKRENIDKEVLLRELLEFAQNLGLDVSEHEAYVCMNGSEAGNESETSIAFKIGEKSAQLGYKADHGINESEKRNSGAQSLILKAIIYLQAVPEVSQECLDLAQRVYDREIEWGSFNVPDAEKEIIDARIEEEAQEREEKQRREAA